VTVRSISEELTQLNVKGLRFWNRLIKFICKFLMKNSRIAKLNWVQNIELIAAPVESDNLPGVTSHKEIC
jgi:hypothetical protein